MDISEFLEIVENREKHTKNKIVVGYLKDEIISFLNKNDVEVHTKEIYLNHKGLAHLSRDSKRQRGAGLSREDIIRIPLILENISAIFFETTKQRFNLLYCENNTKKCIKLVIDTKFVYKGEKLTLIKTAGYINKSDMKNPNFKLIFGEWIV